jgi:DNA repair exonuclease SbcCD ATPase subunit
MKNYYSAALSPRHDGRNQSRVIQPTKVPTADTLRYPTEEAPRIGLGVDSKGYYAPSRHLTTDYGEGLSPKSMHKIERLKDRLENAQSRIKRLEMNEKNVRKLQDMITDLEGFTTNEYSSMTYEPTQNTSRFDTNENIHVTTATRKGSTVNATRQETGLGVVQQLRDELKEKDSIIDAMNKERRRLLKEFQTIYWFLEEIRLVFSELMTKSQPLSKDFVVEKLSFLRKMDEVFQALLNSLSGEWPVFHSARGGAAGTKSKLLYTFNSGEDDTYREELRQLKIIEGYKDRIVELETENRRLKKSSSGSSVFYIGKRGDSARDEHGTGGLSAGDRNALENEVAQLHQMLQDSRGDFTALTEQMMRTNAEKDHQIRELSQEVQNAVRTMDVKNEEIRKAEAKMKANMVTLEIDKKKLEDEITRLRHEISKKNEEVARCAKLVEETSVKLEQRATSVEGERRDLMNAFKEEQRKCTILSEKVTAAENKLAELRVQSSELNGIIIQLRSSLKEKELEYVEMTQVNKHMEHERDDYAKKLISAENNVKSLSSTAFGLQQIGAILTDRLDFANVEGEVLQILNRYLGENGLKALKAAGEHRKSYLALLGKYDRLNEALSMRMQKNVYYLEEFLKIGGYLTHVMEVLGRNTLQELPANVIMLREDLDIKKTGIHLKLTEVANEIGELKYTLQVNFALILNADNLEPTSRHHRSYCTWRRKWFRCNGYVICSRQRK